ncbi:PEP-CTERM system histidine kinase PrsK [Sphingomonas sinipercae]|uniref:histidine kinase n=1 Tax=Sphingomonas sinipercae TaxID=2714944 RepID=A0A6G7ZM48_9SPHN|nr:XrtA/PEP-CTERM system histidine kinase PrsK [Sphingomonas sinipercae]QIL01990.1 PEP-CTERM system histidine kinase PrsK [Sphingomonas sinipercae]
MIGQWTNALAAAAFAVLLAWRLFSGARQPGHWMLLAGFAVTACWSWLAVVMPGSAVVQFAETARNLVWIGLLHSMADPNGQEAQQKGVRLVYGAVSAVLGLQLVVDALTLSEAGAASQDTGRLLRITAAAGALVLVHNLYGQASPGSRLSIRHAMLALTIGWTYDLNLYTVAYLDPARAGSLFEWRGAAIALTGGFFALSARHEQGWRVRLSRAATFQSLSLLAICAYFALMAIIATALRGSSLDWPRTLAIAVLAGLTVAGMVLVPSARARAWAKVKMAKHLFEHRYDYRSEWLRFTATLGRNGSADRPLGERVVKAFADILEAPGGLLLECDAGGALILSASHGWPGSSPRAERGEDGRAFWAVAGANGRIVEVDAVRHGWAHAQDRAIPLPQWILDTPESWVGVPLIHNDRMTGFLLLAAPEYRRPLDWEDFDLLRTAGHQAASSLAEAQTQRALSDAQRFEEFNRRFAFILHDIKNLVSQLSLLTRNAERHAENAEFRSDMIATLNSSIGKMKELLARLSPQAVGRTYRAEPQALRPIVSAAIAARRGRHQLLLLGDASAWVHADAPALEQALCHLLQNAVDASPADQPVTVRIDHDSAEVAITITDKGVGMDPDFVRNALFQPFVSSKPNGFGIGAFEARSLITAMGGRIGVESAPGNGTVFTIRLPAAQPTELDERKTA